MRLYQVVSASIESPGHFFTATLEEALTVARAAVDGAPETFPECAAEVYRCEFETNRAGILALLNSETFAHRERVRVIKPKGKANAY